jgi:regulatory protein
MSQADPARRNETLPPDLDSPPVVLSLDEEEPVSPEVMDAAGALLEKRVRTESDLAERLVGCGYGEDEVESAMVTLRRLGLVDDEAFALTWLETRSGARALGRAGLVEMLEKKGLAREAAEVAVDSSGYDEGSAAIEFSRASLRRVSGLSPARQAAKLQRMLMSRGFEEESVEAAVKAILPPEGWD